MTSTPLHDSSALVPAEISYDLVMDDDMSFVEGTYRLPGGDWQVVIVSAFERDAASRAATLGQRSCGPDSSAPS